jgi:ABC-type transport system involved in multi-copper enzyme maturation permease subunit
MYARLWWKDARQFWPIWLVLIVAAAFTQWMILTFVGQPARFGWLGISALLWASLYALAAGAAAFAGERETGTLKLLDHFPADRSVVWAGKVSFALVTSLALAFLFLLMAAVSTEKWHPQNSLTLFDAACLCMIVPVSLGWGLCWSSITKTALGAALAALACIGLTLIFSGLGTGAILSGDHSLNALLLLSATLVVIVTAAASGAAFASGGWLKWLNIQFRSPIVLMRTESRASRRVPVKLPVDSNPAMPLPPRPIAVARFPETAVIASSLRGAWLMECRALAIQTIKESWQTWLALAAIAITLPTTAAYGFGNSFLDSTGLMLVAVLGCFVAGLSVFGAENRLRTYRFLVHHGARPGLVWAVKLATWIFGLATIALAVASTSVVTSIRISNGPSGDYWSLPLSSPLLIFAIALLCGMTCRRGIAAFVLAMVVSLGVMAPVVSLVFLNLVPQHGVFLVTAAVLAISWAWRKDWMLDRPAPGRWLRLGLYVSTAFALLSACHIGFRVLSVPDVGRIAPPVAWSDDSSIVTSPVRNAADLYREAGRHLIERSESAVFLSQNQETLGLIRRAAAIPDCQFERPGKQTLIDPARIPPVAQFGRLVSLEARDRLKNGDLAGSWEDLIVLFRMAGQLTEGSGIEPAHSAIKSVERGALTLAIEWALAPGQTPERIHAALASYRNLPKMPNPSEIVRAEANIFENTLDLPDSTFRPWLTQALFDQQPAQDGGQLYAFTTANMISAPWEIERARRLNRLFSAALIEIASREPGQRADQAALWTEHRDLTQALQGTPRLMMTLFGNAGTYIDSDDRNQVGRRALELILALRSWQLKHDGQLPDHLGALVPEELPALPKDPFGSRTFGYARWNGQRTVPLRSVLDETWDSQFLSDPPTPGLRVLYSLGPDRRDEGGAASTNTKAIHAGDIGFLIPAVDAKAPPKKD